MKSILKVQPASQRTATSICAGLRGQSPKLAVTGSISVIREVNLYRNVQNQLNLHVSSTGQASHWNLLLFPQPIMTAPNDSLLVFLYPSTRWLFQCQSLLSTCGTILNIHLSVSLLCDLLSDLETFISEVLRRNSYIFYDYCYQDDSACIGLYHNNDTWLDELLSKSQTEILISWFWLCY